MNLSFNKKTVYLIQQIIYYKISNYNKKVFLILEKNIKIINKL
jgi:hypothetical protein